MAWTIAITALVTLLVVTLAMNFKTSEKTLERKIEHRYAVADPQFRREMGVLLGPGIIPGNRVTDLENGDEIFPAMLEAIRAATKTITFETYIYWSGDIGAKFADALAERARAGVKVKVMVDWVGSIKMDACLFASCLEPPPDHCRTWTHSVHAGDVAIPPWLTIFALTIFALAGSSWTSAIARSDVAAAFDTWATLMSFLIWTMNFTVTHFFSPIGCLTSTLPPPVAGTKHSVEAFFASEGTV